MRNRIILAGFSLFGLVATTLTIKRRGIKEMLIVYLLKCTISSFLDQIVVNKGCLKYPVRLFPKAFKTSVLFDYLMFPWGCVAYYKLTKDTNIKNWITKLLMFVIPMSLLELLLLKKTRLITFKKWSISTTVLSEATVCLGIRFLMELVNKWAKDDSQSTQIMSGG